MTLTGFFKYEWDRENKGHFEVVASAARVETLALWLRRQRPAPDELVYDELPPEVVTELRDRLCQEFGLPQATEKEITRLRTALQQAEQAAKQTQAPPQEGPGAGGNPAGAAGRDGEI